MIRFRLRWLRTTSKGRRILLFLHCWLLIAFSWRLIIAHRTPPEWQGGLWINLASLRIGALPNGEFAVGPDFAGARAGAVVCRIDADPHEHRWMAPMLVTLDVSAHVSSIRAAFTQEQLQEIRKLAATEYRREHATGKTLSGRTFPPPRMQPLMAEAIDLFESGGGSAIAVYPPGVRTNAIRLVTAIAAGYCAIATAILALREIRTWRRKKSLRCPACGYQLAADSGRCPECGAEFDGESPSLPCTARMKNGR